MTTAQEAPVAGPPMPLQALTVPEIVARVEECQHLPALRLTSDVLREQLHGENQNTQQIAEAIRRDPILTFRLLCLMNTVQFGLTNPVARIDQAVLYLGTFSVRELVDTTPVIDESGEASHGRVFNWKQLWAHCIATATVTQELCRFSDLPRDDMPYVAGLLHDIGKILMAFAFPEHFQEVRRRVDAGENDLLRVEREVLGMDHAELGAHYLVRHHLPSPLISAAKLHHAPLGSSKNKILAAVQIADALVRQAKVGHSGHPSTPANVPNDSWKVLLPPADAADRSKIRQSIAETMAQLPTLLKTLL